MRSKNVNEIWGTAEEKHFPETRKITKIEAEKLAIGMLQILTSMYADNKENPEKGAGYPVAEFERLIMESKGVSRSEAERVTDAVINTGIIRWDMSNNLFVI